MDMPDILRPRQLGDVDATPKQVRGMLEAEQFAPHAALEFIDCVGCAIREHAFRLRPDMFVGIEFRRVGGKAIGISESSIRV